MIPPRAVGTILAVRKLINARRAAGLIQVAVSSQRFVNRQKDMDDALMSEVSVHSEPEEATAKVPRTFREVYCLVHSCDLTDFEEQLFWRSLYPHAIPFALYFELVNPRFFRSSRELIRRLGSALSQVEVERELLHFNNRRVLGWSDGRAQIRVSTARLGRIAASYFSLAPRNGPVRPLAA